MLLMAKHWKFVLQVEYRTLIAEQSLSMAALCGLLLHSINTALRGIATCQLQLLSTANYSLQLKTRRHHKIRIRGVT